MRPKLYCYTDIKTNKLVKKASGLDSSQLSYSDYVKLAKGQNIITNKKIFRVDWTNLNLIVYNQQINLNSIEDKDLKRAIVIRPSYPLTKFNFKNRFNNKFVGYSRGYSTIVNNKDITNLEQVNVLKDCLINIKKWDIF